MILPNDANLLNASLARRGDDLLIGGADRPALIILDYFTADRSPDLQTEGGAVLPGRVIAKLAGPDLDHPEMAAQAQDQAVIGHIETVEGEVIITRADGSQVIASVGTPVFQDDVIVTDGAGSVGLRFVDGMTLSLGADARMVLDEFVYQPEAGEGGGIIEIIQGAFSFVSGAAAKMGLDSMVIETPTMTIGIRGTKVVANASAEGETTEVVLLPEDDGTIGKIMITTDAGQELLEEAFVSTTVTSRFLPPAPQTMVAPDWVYSHFSQSLAALPAPTIEDNDRPPFEIDMPSLDISSRFQDARDLGPRDPASSEPVPEGRRSQPEPITTTAPADIAVDSATGEPSLAPAEDDLPDDGTDTLDLVDNPNFGLPEPKPSVPDNQAPTVAAPITDTGTAENAAFTYDVAASFTDADVASGDALSFSAARSDGAALPTWLTIDPATGILAGTPDDDGVGSMTVTVTATDTAGASVATSFMLTVTNVNDTPVVITPIADTGAVEDAVFSYDTASSFRDDDSVHGDSLSFSASLSGGAPLPAWLSIDPTTGILSGTPAHADVGGLTVDITATDDAGTGVSASFQLTVTNSNDTPVVVTPIADTSTAEDASFSYDVSANFADDDSVHGDSLSFSASLSGGAPLPAWLSIDPATGVLSGTPLNADVGAIAIDVVATDDAGASVVESFQLTVTNTNDNPVVFTPIADASTAEDTAFSYDASTNFGDDDSIHGDSLTFSAGLSGGAPLPAWLSIDPTTGVLSGTPVNTDVGVILVDVTATDDVGASVVESFQLTVANSNDSPVVVTPIADTGTAEDASFSYDVSASFADDDGVHGDSLTFTATQGNGAPMPAWLSIDASTGVLSGTPADADVAILTISVVATDDAGAEASASFQLSVTNVNDAPVVVTPIADANPLQDAAFTYDVSASFADDDALHGDTLSFAAEQSGGATLPAWLTIDPTTGVLSGTPDASQVGIPYTIVVTATDGSSASAASTFNLSVDNVNDAPVLNVLPSPSLTAVAANATDPAGDTIADIIVDGSISDADGGAVEAIALTGVDDTNGTWQFSLNDGASWNAVGSVSDAAATLLDGSARLRFIPDSGYGGSATFTFRAWDQTTGSNGQTAVDVSTNGGSTAFSALSDTGSVSVQGTAPDLTSGAEFQVNTTTADKQEVPSVAALADGGFVIVWESDNQDGDRGGIYAQRYDSTSSAVGAEFQINTTTADEQTDPSVAALDDGGFVVVWQSRDQDGDNWGVFSQRYDSAGSAVGAETQVNSTTTQAQDTAAVTALGDGGFVIVWQSRDQDGDKDGIYGQRFDSSGATVGSEFQINSTTTEDQQKAAVAALEDGGFVVTWQSKNQDGDDWGIYAQRYDSAGAASGSEFRVNTTTADQQKEPSVASLDDGGFVIVWQSRNQDGDNWGVYGQRYDAAGDPVEFEFQINQETADEQKEPSVSALADGGFIVSWQSRNQDGDNWGIYGRRYSADGDPLGREFQINSTSADEQKEVATAALGDGGLAVAWQSRNQDGDDGGVYGHRYESETVSATVNPPTAEAASMLDFGGSDSYVDIGDPGSSSDDLDPGRGDFTVEAWFYYDGPNGRQSIVSKGNEDALDAGFNIFLDDDTLVVRASTDGGLDGAAMKVTLSGTPGWHHVAMVLDQESGSAASSIRGYLDGSDAGWTTGHGIIFSSTVTTSASRQIETDERFLIGAADKNGTAEDFFDAEIADVRVWNSTRSQEEIQADLGRTLNGDEPHLLANWQLDDGVGPVANDSTGSYDGALTGSPTWQDALDLTTAQNTTIAGRLSASDPEGDSIAYSVLAGAANGTATIDADKGTWSYDPDAGFSGSDGFSYQVSDGQGGVDTVTIAVTVTP